MASKNGGAGTSSGKMGGERGDAQGVSLSDIGPFLREAAGELEKVSPPTRAETIQATLVTVVIVVVVSLSLFLADAIFNRVMMAFL